MATSEAYPFSPSYAFPPGETLAEVLESRDMSQAELAERTGLTPKTVNELVKGKAPVTPETALHLERVLGLPASFWNGLQRRFDEWQAREVEASCLKRWAKWAERFPARSMARREWIERPADQVDAVRCLLNFFGTATPEAWESWWHGTQEALHPTTAHEADEYSLASWLRRGEILAWKMKAAPYDETRFREALDLARLLTPLPEIEFKRKLIEACSEAGVAVVLVPELDGARTHGATRWLSPRKALIQLNVRRKSDDELWFTFFHQAAHVLLHPKRRVFLEVDDKGDDREKEADRFASDNLIQAAPSCDFVVCVA